MLHAKFQDHKMFGSGEKRVLKVSNIYLEFESVES